MNKNYFIKFFSTLICLSIILFSFLTFLCYLYCWNAYIVLPSNVPQEFLRVKIYGTSSESDINGKDGSTVSGTISIIDSNGNEIAAIERSWSGSYLAVEFARVDAYNKCFIFPCRIYGKNKIAEERRERYHGTLLEKYYDDYGQCMLLGYESSLNQRKHLYRIATFATGKYKIPTFGFVSRFSIDLSNCRPDHYYSICFNEAGDYYVYEL